jgi:hypothetical protein
VLVLGHLTDHRVDIRHWSYERSAQFRGDPICPERQWNGSGDPTRSGDPKNWSDRMIEVSAVPHFGSPGGPPQPVSRLDAPGRWVDPRSWSDRMIEA